ncbi:MAG TPA: penicillin acylase family protein [Chitinophagaceae bacterium]|nr:penicillin acylase family protein [Chitinophagaceae bacterium]
MRILPFILSAIITLALVFALNQKWGSVPPLGKFLSPQQGFWQNAEPRSQDLNETLLFDSLKGDVNVYLDERLVPHLFAEQEYDAYFVQGYLHAKYRLWQMEFQTYAAAGRIAEILGNDPRFIHFDKEQRRLGMVYAAENAQKAMERDPFTKSAVDAYTSGVNAYINSLTESTLPVEYKLLDYKPEQWSNLKVGLFLKLMSKDLAGYERDLEFTNAKSLFSTDELNVLYPQLSDSSVPFINAVAFDTPAIKPVKPITANSLYFKKDTTLHAVEISKPNRLNGSNNWALSGQKTASGAPILCNDPHLALSLPSIWYEMQISTPTMNVYGATFPGSPSVIIGFNDSIAFGFTNAMRDVKDYYQVRFKDASKKEYWYENAWQPTDIRIEQIKVRGATTVWDTVAYTAFGPVMYDASFTTSDTTNHTAIAARWTAHDVSNEGLMWLKLNRAKNYADYLDAIKDLSCPGQNVLFASKSGDIALWQQGRFPALWNGQGLYVMPGEDSSYRWQGFIPQSQNPHVLNPPAGFIESANQRPVDSSYPYFIPGNYIVSRGITLNRRLQAMQGATPQDMMELQNDVHDEFAATAIPLLLKNTNDSILTDGEKEYLAKVRSWDFEARADGEEETIFKTWWESLYKKLLADDMAALQKPVVMPDNQTVLELLLRDSTLKYIDDISTPERETLPQQVTAALQSTVNSLQPIARQHKLAWWKEKNTSIFHLLRTVVPFARTGLEVGGWRTTVNAITNDHGPSWRMIVQLSNPTEAYGVYPGGQSGNPGSRFYDSFIDTWAAGKYYTLWIMKATEKSDKRIIGTLSFSKS